MLKKCVLKVSNTLSTINYMLPTKNRSSTSDDDGSACSCDCNYNLKEVNRELFIENYLTGRSGSKMRSSSYLKRVMSDRKTAHPQMKTWRCVVLNPEPDWVQYKGLWGVKSLLSDESGPPGPKWDRPRKGQVGVQERKRWGRPLDWLAELEKHTHNQGETHVHSTSS